MQTPQITRFRQTFLLLLAALCLASSGCYAPIRSPGIWANELPDSFRYPYRSLAPRLNYASLTAPPPTDYILGKDDVLEVTVPDLFAGAEIRPMTTQVMSSGEINLPLVGNIHVAGKNLLQAQQAITDAYADGIIANPKVNIALATKSTYEILVMGEVIAPGVISLPKYQNDVGHALASAGGYTGEAAEFIEIHRRMSPALARAEGMPHPNQISPNERQIIRIPLRGLPPDAVKVEDIVLESGDVVFVPGRKSEVFWVVGQLDESNLVRFSLGDRERELGAGLILPRDRDIDVVTAVAMAGYIDPIDSPTTVTVHRRLLDGDQLLIKVDLIAARYNPRDTVLVQPGDIIYVNPDGKWYTRRQVDRIIPELFLSPWRFFMGRHITP